LPRCKKPENGVKPTRPKPLKQPLLLAALRRDSLALMCRKLTRLADYLQGSADGGVIAAGPGGPLALLDRGVVGCGGDLGGGVFDNEIHGGLLLLIGRL
jgi:hypothetical protein